MKWILGFIAVFMIPEMAFGYGTETHAYLTSEAFSLFKRSAQIDESLRPFLIDGARREDDQFRMLNHFYDPVNDRGFTSQILGNGSRSKDWAVNADLQNQKGYKIATAIDSILSSIQSKKLALISTESDFTWQKGIRAYARGEKEKAMYILGHTLHLLEDASVPDHTRNDAHPDGSPYEKWTSRFSINTPDSMLVLKDRKIVPNLELAFNEISSYSNNNFYSKNTLGIATYVQPQVEFIETINGRSYAAKLLNNSSQILYFKKSGLNSLIIENQLSITLDDDIVMQDYWKHLAPKAIEYSAGVIELFIKEGEKAKNDPEFVRAEPSTLMGTILGVGQKISSLIGKYLNPKAEIDTIALTNEKEIVVQGKEEAPPPKNEVAKEASPKVALKPVVVEQEIPVVSDSIDLSVPNTSLESIAQTENKPVLDSPITAPPMMFHGGAPAGPSAPIEPILADINIPPVNTSTSTTPEPEPVILDPDPIEEIPEVIPEIIASSSLKIGSFGGLVSSTSIMFSWSYSGPENTTSSISLGADVLYSGTSTIFKLVDPPIGESIFWLKVSSGSEEALASTTINIAEVKPDPGTVEDLRLEIIPGERALVFTAKIHSNVLGEPAFLHLEFITADATFGAANYITELVEDGGEASIRITQVQDGRYKWRAFVGGPDSRRSDWQGEEEREILIPISPAKISTNYIFSSFPNGYCGHGMLEIIPETDIQVSFADFWASCVNGKCYPHNNFKIFNAEGVLLAETDGHYDFFGGLEPFHMNQRINNGGILLKAGEVYRATPHSVFGQCMVRFEEAWNTVLLQ